MMYKKKWHSVKCKNQLDSWFFSKKKIANKQETSKLEKLRVEGKCHSKDRLQFSKTYTGRMLQRSEWLIELWAIPEFFQPHRLPCLFYQSHFHSDFQDRIQWNSEDKLASFHLLQSPICLTEIRDLLHIHRNVKGWSYQRDHQPYEASQLDRYLLK